MRAIFIPVILIPAAVAPLRAQPADCERIPDEVQATARLQQAALDSIRGHRTIRDALEDDLRESARAAGIAEPRGIVMAQLRGQQAPRVWSYRSNVPDELSRTVVARHAEALARWRRSDGLVNLRLDHLPWSESVDRECMPVLMDPGGFAEDLARIQEAQRTGIVDGTRREMLYLTMLVTRDGDVAYAELRRPSSSREVDREVLRLGRRLRFRPGALGNVPVDVWVVQPLDMVVPNE